MTMPTLKTFPKRLLMTSLLVAGLNTSYAAQAQSNLAHHDDYREALELVAQSEVKLAAAMEQVQSGQVAHYDFLQNEHIELIRHSRALAWPPGDLASADKDALKKDAQALLDSAQSLEWVIADYLRAFAQVRSAASNTLDIAEQVAPSVSDSTKADLQTLQIETLKFMASAYREGSQQLTEAFDVVLANDLSEQTHRELSFQKERFAEYPAQLQGFIDNIVDSDVDERAAKLQAIYEAAI